MKNLKNLLPAIFRWINIPMILSNRCFLTIPIDGLSEFKIILLPEGYHFRIFTAGKPDPFKSENSAED